MKKITKVLFGLLIIALVFGQNKVVAKSYSIDKVDIQNVINTDGTMTVKENRDYNFSGSYTFAYQTISKQGQRSEPYSLDSFELCEGADCYRQLMSNEISQADVEKPEKTFYVTNNGNKYYIKWFYRAESEVKHRGRFEVGIPTNKDFF